MAELDLNYDLPWLQQKPDSNQPMSLAEAFQLRQRQQQLSMEKALLPLKQQEMQAQIANAALDRQISQEKLAAMLKAKAGAAASWEQISKIDNWLDPAQTAPLYAQWARDGIAPPDAVQFVEKSIQGAQMFSSRQEKLQNENALLALRIAQKEKESPAVDAILNADRMDAQAKQLEAAGNTVEALHQRRNAELLRGSVKGQVPDSTAVIKNVEYRLEQEKKGLAARGAPPMTAAEESDKRIQYFAEQTVKPGEQIIAEQTPNGMNFRIIRGGTAGETIATATQAQTHLMQLQRSIQQLDNMTTDLRPEDVGIAGKITDLKTRWIRQFIPGAGDPTTEANRAQGKAAFDQYIAAQEKNGIRMTAPERQSLRDAFFDTAKVGQQYDQIVAAANMMKTIQKMDAIVTAKNGLQPLQPYMFIGLLASDYAKLIKAGTLTKDEALEWARKVNPQ